MYAKDGTAEIFELKHPLVQIPNYLAGYFPHPVSLSCFEDLSGTIR